MAEDSIKRLYVQNVDDLEKNYPAENFPTESSVSKFLNAESFCPLVCAE